MPGEVNSGVEIERFCNGRQLEALKQIGARKTKLIICPSRMGLTAALTTMAIAIGLIMKIGIGRGI